MTMTADAIIIGAGVHGASLGFHLARRGLRPLLLEAGAVGGGATGRSSGLVRMHYDFAPDSRLAWESFGWFSLWSERVGGDCGFVRTGFVQLVPAEYAEQLRANVAIQRSLGIRTEVIDAAALAELAPDLTVDDVVAAAYEPLSGYADPNGTTLSLLAAARRLGAHLIQGETVQQIVVAGGRVRGVRTQNAAYAAPIVVDAAGAWAGQVAQMVGLELPLKVWRHDTAYVGRAAEPRLAMPAVIDHALALYARPEGEALTLVGLEDANEIGGVADRETASVAPGFTGDVATRIPQRIPRLGDGYLHSAHSGQDGITPDQRPIIDQAGPDGFFLDCGFSGTGFKTAPAVGDALARLILSGPSSAPEIEPYRAGRFAMGSLLAGDYPYAPIWR
jgi:sarcosine oxidase, subunit beta